jgi:hypothetical protein
MLERLVIMKLRHLLVLLPLVVLFLGSCNEKGSETDYNPNVNSSKEFIFAEDILFEMVNIYFKGVTDTAVLGSGYKKIDSCNILYIPSEDKMIFDYGGWNHWCPDKKLRRGKFHASFNGPLFTQGTLVTFTIDSLFVDENLVEGNMNSEFLGLDNSGKHQLSFQVSQGKITLNDTVNVSVIHFETDYMLTWEEGQQTTGIHEDDMLLVTGNGSGRGVDQFDFELFIQEPLKDYIDCFWIQAGMHRITLPNAQVRDGSIDYITTDGCFYRVNFYFGESEFFEHLKF